VQLASKFVATDKHGDRYIIRAYRANQPNSTALLPTNTPADDQTQLWAEDGYFVIRVARGIYDMICGAEKVRLTSHDPEAA
jgi:hypothetical protein